jgi:DNA-binding response OmpR family regulator
METTSRKTILIVEDEHDLLDPLALRLRKAGFRLSTAMDGAAGNVTCVSLNCFE